MGVCFSNTSRRLADTEQEVDDLKRLNDELNRKLREQTAKVGCDVTRTTCNNKSTCDTRELDGLGVFQMKAVEQERAQSKQRASSLQQEVNRLRQEYLHLKEGLNSEHQTTVKHVDQMNALRKQLGRSRITR